jgi:hypothetical protein
MKNSNVLLFIILLFIIKAQAQTNPIFEIDRCTNVILNEDNTAFQIQFDNGDLRLESEWQKKSYTANFYEIYNEVLPVQYYYMEGYLINSIYHNNVIKVKDTSKYGASIEFEEYFTVELHHNKLFIHNRDYKTENMQVINLQSGYKEEYSNTMKAGKTGSFIYFYKYGSSFPIKQKGGVYIYNFDMDTTSRKFDIPTIRSIPNPYLAGFKKAFCEQFNLPFNTEKKTALADSNFVSCFERYNSNDTYRKSILGKNTELYKSPHSVVIHSNESILILDDEKKEPFILTRDNHYFSSYTTSRIKDDLLRVTEFADENLKRKEHPSIQFYSLKNKTCLLMSLPTMNISEVSKNALNTIDNKDIIYFDILNDRVLYANASYHWINHKGDVTEFEANSAAEIIMKIYDADSIWQYCYGGNQNKLNEMKELFQMQHASSETSNFYKVSNTTGDFIVNEDIGYFNRSFEIDSSSADIIPVCYNLLMRINKDKTFSLTAKSYDLYEDRHPELNYVEIHLPDSITGLSSVMNYQGEMTDFKPIYNLDYTKLTIDQLNKSIQKIKAGIIPVSEHNAIIKAFQDDQMETLDMLNDDGEFVYDAEGFPMTEDRLRLGAFNSGVYSFETNKWIFSPTAKEISLTENGYLASYPVYEDHFWGVKYVAYDKEGNELWHKEIRNNKDRASLMELICKENNQEIFLIDNGYHFAQDKSGKQHLLHQGKWNSMYSYGISNVDAILSSEPLIYLRNDSVFIENDKEVNGRRTAERVITFIVKQPKESYILTTSGRTDKWKFHNEVSNEKWEKYLDLNYPQSRGRLVSRNNKLAFLKFSYSEDYLDEEGEPKYDNEGFPISIEVMPKSLVYVKLNGTYQLQLNEVLPILGNNFYGYMELDTIDGKPHTECVFYKGNGKLHKKLNKESVQSAYQIAMTSYIVGFINTDSKNNAILINTSGKIIARNYTNFSMNSENQLMGTKIIGAESMQEVIKLK